MSEKRNIPMTLDPREQALIAHAQHYREHFSHAGAPGHNQYLLIAKLAAHLEDAVSRFGYAPDADPPVRVQKVAWSDTQDGVGCWRDLITGVKVEL